MSVESILQMAYAMWLERGGGFLFLLPLAPLVLVQLYKTETVQGLLQKVYPKAVFSSLPMYKQMLVSFLVGALPVFGTYVFTVPIAQAIVLAASAGLAAVFGFKPFKALAMSGPATKAAATLPSFMVKPLGVVIPVDVEKVLLHKASK